MAQNGTRSGSDIVRAYICSSWSISGEFPLIEITITSSEDETVRQ